MFEPGLTLNTITAKLSMVFNEGDLSYNYYLTSNFSLESKDDFLSGRRKASHQHIELSFGGIPSKGQSPYIKYIYEVF